MGEDLLPRGGRVMLVAVEASDGLGGEKGTLTI